ncbi:MAG: hypothetical protein MH204_09565 [Fimbriimonadaceae bacterium]|nr:hypothetical protein [Fimbriimonadaceae bacterium]
MGRIQGAVEAERNLNDLDRLADGLRAGLNSLHRTGIGADGSTGIDFFDASGSGSRSLRLSAEVSASAQAIAAGTTGNAGDGGLAQALAALRDSNSISGQTFAGYYDSLVQSNADAASLFGQELDVATAVGAQISEQRASVSGVNLDEEFADMVKMQRSYQAAARALSVFDQVTEELLGIIR